MKKCNNCGTCKPLTTEFFHRGKDTKEGFKSSCKICRSFEKKKWRDKNKEKVNYVNRQYYRKNIDEISKKQKIHYHETKDKRSEYQKEYYKKNKKQELERTSKWAKENPKKVKEKYNRYVEKNHEKLLRIRKSYREKPEFKEKVKEYKQSEKYKQLNKRYKHTRRTNEKNSISTLSLAQWNECLEHFNHSCCYCGGSKEKITQDHFIPVSEGGEYTVKNIVPACGPCNFSKNNRPFKNWYPKQKTYSVIRENEVLKYLGYEKGEQQTVLF